MTRFTTIALTIGGIVSISLATIVAVYAFGGTVHDDVIITMIIAFVAPTITTLVALLKSNETQADIKETKDDVQKVSTKVDNLNSSINASYTAMERQWRQAMDESKQSRHRREVDKE